MDVEAGGQPQAVYLRCVDLVFFFEAVSLLRLNLIKYVKLVEQRKPKDLPVSASPELGLQTCATTPDF